MDTLRTMYFIDFQKRVKKVERNAYAFPTTTLLPFST